MLYFADEGDLLRAWIYQADGLKVLGELTPLDRQSYYDYYDPFYVFHYRKRIIAFGSPSLERIFDKGRNPRLLSYYVCEVYEKE